MPISKSYILGMPDWIEALEADEAIPEWQVWLGVREPCRREFYYRLSGQRTKYYRYLPGEPMRICKTGDFTALFEQSLRCADFTNLVNLTFEFPPPAAVCLHDALDDRWIVSCHANFRDLRLPVNEQVQTSTKFLVGLDDSKASLQADAALLALAFS